jgi:hypothetical protein
VNFSAEFSLWQEVNLKSAEGDFLAFDTTGLREEAKAATPGALTNPSHMIDDLRADWLDDLFELQQLNNSAGKGVGQGFLSHCLYGSSASLVDIRLSASGIGYSHCFGRLLLSHDSITWPARSITTRMLESRKAFNIEMQ